MSRTGKKPIEAVSGVTVASEAKEAVASLMERKVRVEALLKHSGMIAA